MLFFSFAIEDSMFRDGEVSINRKTISPGEAKEMIDKSSNKLIACLNPSHAPTINAIRDKFNINVSIPEKAISVRMNAGDSLIVMSIRGLPRLDASRHEYTQKEIDGASFTFSHYYICYKYATCFHDVSITKR